MWPQRSYSGGRARLLNTFSLWSHNWTHCRDILIRSTYFQIACLVSPALYRHWTPPTCRPHNFMRLVLGQGQWACPAWDSAWLLPCFQSPHSGWSPVWVIVSFTRTQPETVGSEMLRKPWNLLVNVQQILNADNHWDLRSRRYRETIQSRHAYVIFTSCCFWWVGKLPSPHHRWSLIRLTERTVELAGLRTCHSKAGHSFRFARGIHMPVPMVSGALQH